MNPRRLLRAVIVAALLVPLTISAQTSTMPTVYTWTAPTTGSAVHHYEVQISASTPILWVSPATATTTSTSATIPLQVGGAWIVRVRGVDAQGRVGLWSDASEAHTPDPGPPGACGKPVRQ